jgi:hypothetical protein
MDVLGKKVRYRTCGLTSEGLVFATQGSGYLITASEGGYKFNKSIVIDESAPEIKKYYKKRYRYIYRSLIKEVYDEEKKRFKTVNL